MPFTFHINPDDSARSLRRRKESPLVNTKTLDTQEVKGLGMRIAKERFDPNAFDGDGDGLVQDASEFERPSVPLNVGIPFGLNSVTGDYSGRGYANLSPKEVAEKAVPDSPQRFVEQLLQHKRRDDLTNAQYLESFSKDLLENLGSTEPFDFSPQAVKVLRVALEKSLTDSPSFHDEVGRFGMPPVVMFKKGAMTRLVSAAYEYEHNWMSFNPNTFSTGAIQNIKKRMNTSKLFVNGFGAKGTKKQIVGVEVPDYFRHEYGHYLNDIALETAPLGSRQMALASYYALDDWESTEFLMNTLGIDDEELNILSGNWRDIVDAIELNEEMPDGFPFVGTQYGQTNPAEMFAEGVSAYLSDDEDIHGLLNPVLKSHIQEVLGKPIRTVTPSKRTEERNAIGLRSSQKPTAPTGGKVQMPSFYDVTDPNDPNIKYPIRHGNIGITPTSADWLKDASDDEIAELVVVRSMLDHATFMAQMNIGENWNNLSRAEQHMEIQTVIPTALAGQQEHALDYSPEAIKRAQDLVKEALKDPAFAWYVRTFGLPPITATTSDSAREARLSGRVSSAVGDAPGNGAGAWFQPIGRELTHGITMNFEIIDVHGAAAVSPAGQIDLWRRYQTADGEIQLPWNVQRDTASTLRHEYGHYLYWKLTRHSSDTQLLALGMTPSQIKANRAELRDLFNDKTGWAFGDPTVSTPLTSMYYSPSRGGARIMNKDFNPTLFMELAVNGYPVVFSGYAMADPQETFAEGFAAFTSPHSNVRSTVLTGSFRNTLARLSGITVTGETKGQHTSSGGTHDKPWERNVSGLASKASVRESSRVIGEGGDASKPSILSRAKEKLRLNDRQVGHINSMTNKMHSIFTSGKIYDEPIHPAIDDRRKELLDSIRVVRAEGGMTMIVAEPNPVFNAYLPVKRDWASIELPPREAVAEVIKKLSSNNGSRRSDTYGVNEFTDHLASILQEIEKLGEGPGSLPYEGGEGNYVSYVQQYYDSIRNPVGASRLLIGSDGMHDAFGHFGTGRGYDRHGEWANYLAMKDMIDASPLTDEEKEDAHRFWFREYGWIQFGKRGDLKGVDDGLRFMADDYDGPFSEILDIIDSGHNGLDDAPTEDTGKSISNISASELRQAAENDAEAQLNRNPEPELGIADLRAMGDSELQSMLSSTDDPLLRNRIEYVLLGKGENSKTLPWVAVVTKSFIDNAPQEKSLEQDSPELWKEIRKNLLKSDKGGKAGEWTARKQQMLVKMYKDAGGGFRGTLRSTNRSIKRWSRERYARSESTSNGTRRYSDAGVSGVSNRSQKKTNKRTVIGRSRGDKASTKRKPRTMGRNLRGD